MHALSLPSSLSNKRTKDSGRVETRLEAPSLPPSTPSRRIYASRGPFFLLFLVLHLGTHLCVLSVSFFFYCSIPPRDAFTRLDGFSSFFFVPLYLEGFFFFCRSTKIRDAS